MVAWRDVEFFHTGFVFAKGNCEKCGASRDLTGHLLLSLRFVFGHKLLGFFYHFHAAAEERYTLV